MILSKQILANSGFDCNHPDYVLCKFHKSPKNGDDWHITVEQDYIPQTNHLAWNVSCWKLNDKHVISKRVQCGLIDTVEELRKILDLCTIDCEIDVD